MRSISRCLCVLYPFLIVSSISPVLSAEVAEANQVARHVVIWLLAMLGAFHSRSVLHHDRIRLAVILAGTASATAVLLWFAKVWGGGELPWPYLYSAAEPVATVLAAATASVLLMTYRHERILLTSLVFSLLLFVWIHFDEGLQLFTDVYGRTRMLLGFSHPGKLSQVVAILALFLLFTRSNLSATKGANVRTLGLGAIGIFVLLTSTRSTLVILVIAALGRIFDRVTVGGRFLIYILLGVIIALGIVYLYFTIDQETQSYLFSGRIELWQRTMTINSKEFGPAMYLVGADSKAVAGYSFYISGLVAQGDVFRVDNAFIEVLILHGLPVLVLLTASLLSLIKLDPWDSRPLVIGVIILFFQFGESGFVAAGGWFAFLLLTLQMWTLRVPGAHFKAMRGARVARHPKEFSII